MLSSHQSVNNAHKCREAFQQYLVCMSNKEKAERCEGEFYKKCVWKWTTMFKQPRTPFQKHVPHSSHVNIQP